MSNKTKVFLDYPVSETKEFQGLTFPQVLYDFLRLQDDIEMVSESDQFDVLFIISGGSHYSHLNTPPKRSFIIKVKDKLKKVLKKVLKKNNYSGLMGRNLYYEQRVKDLLQKNPAAKVIHRLDSRYRNLCKVYGFDETVEFINKYASSSVYQTIFGQNEYEVGIDTIFGFQNPVPIKNSILINNGVDTEVFSSKGDKFDWAGKIKIIHVATTGMTRKGLGKLLEIANLVKDNEDIQFYLIGRQEMDPIYGRDIGQFSNVHKFPHTSDRYLLAKYYRSADILLYPTIDDCSPNVVIEAMSCGLPVIAADSGGTPELIIKEDIQAGLLLQDQNPLYALREMTNNLELFKTNTQELIGKYHSKEVMGEKYLKLIKNVISS
jgi:glycosyltransferase involved in cell wall biosynthesis